MGAVPPERPPDAAAREEALGAFSHQLAEALSWFGDVPRETVERAAVDPLYMYGLVALRDTPDAVSGMITEPCGKSLPKWAPRPTPVLIAKAAYALARWAAAGFGQVDPDTAERRRRACLACPELRAPGGQAIHRVAGLAGNTVCGLCSCAVDKKAMLPTESCPAPAPDDPSLTRWGEPCD